MLHYVTNFISYLNYDVIEPNWIKFNDNLKTIKNFEDIIKCHNNFLDKCLEETFLPNNELQLNIIDLGKAIQGFVSASSYA